MTEHGDQGEQGIRGERGPAGDTGEQGAAGPSGMAGIMGLTGIGERGMTGDHGQPGAVGETGRTGDTGEQGVPGKAARNWTRPLLAAFVFVVATALVGALAIQRLDRVAAENAAANERDACFAMVLTDVVESLEERESLSSQTSAALREYVAAAVDGKVALADAFTLILAGEATEEEQIAALEAATAAIRRAGEVGDSFDTLSSELAQVRREHPTPEIADIEACG